MKTVKLLYPEWQAYGVDPDVFHGALALAQTMFTDSDVITIEAPVEEALRVRDGVLGLDSIAPRFHRALDQLRASAPDVVMTIGGTCGTEAAPVAYLNERYDGDLAVVWFDAHGDLNTPASSPSGHFHGMVLRTLVGTGPREYVAALRRPLQPSQIFLAGTRDLDSDEAAYIREAGVSVTTPSGLADPGALASKILGRAFRNVYLHLDLDCFSPEQIPDSLMRTPGGPAFDEVELVHRTLQERFNVVGFSFVEYVDRGGGSLSRLKRFAAAIDGTSTAR